MQKKALFVNMTQIDKFDNEIVSNLATVLGVEPITAKLLVSRGITDETLARKFLCPKLDDLADFGTYTGVEQAKERLLNAIANGEKIIVYGDYDCDGVCASSILSEAIKSHGGDVEIYIPKRLEEGYGLSRDSIERIADEHFPDLIITVDCGITSKDVVDYCINELGIDVIVTDHHEPPKDLPECIVINPHLDEQKGYFCDYCGAGVAFMLVTYVYGINFSARFLDIVAVATMGDVVPLKGDNRILVYYGLKKLEKSPCLGLKMTFESLGQRGRYTAEDIAFKIVPRINSLGRLGDAKRAVSLFTDTDYFVLDCLIKEMNDENLSRRALCDKVEAEALECAKPLLNNCKIIILYGNWHKGVLGIVASRLTERFMRPTILFCYEDGVLKGSCRSIDKINIYELLSKFSHRFIQFGGHSQAAGVTMMASEFMAFRDEINDYVESNYPSEVFTPDYEYDVDITGVNVDRKFFLELERFAPFGEGNPQPVFHALETAGKYHHSKNNIAHLSATTKRGYNISAFSKGDSMPLLNSGVEKHCYYTLGINIFNDKEYLQAVLKGISVDNLDKLTTNDDAIINYAKTASYPQNEVQLLDKNDFYRVMCELYSENDFGNLTVCYSKDTYDELTSVLQDNELNYQTYYGANTLKNSINAIVYAPNADYDYTIYDNVLFADKPLRYPNEDGYDIYSNEDECLVLSELIRLKLDRNRVGEYFKRIKLALSNATFKSVESAIHFLKLDSEKVEFSLSWQILEEVGLIEKNKEGIFYIKNIRTELTNSPLYCIINQND